MIKTYAKWNQKHKYENNDFGLFVPKIEAQVIKNSPYPLSKKPCENSVGKPGFLFPPLSFLVRVFFLNVISAIIHQFSKRVITFFLTVVFEFDVVFVLYEIF